MKRMTSHYMTLVELIVAMAIFLVMMLVLAAMLNDTIKLSRKRKGQSDNQHQQQVLNSIFSRDLENMVASNVINQEVYLGINGSSAAFVTTSSIGVDPSASGTCPLNGVFYHQSGGNLYRAVKQLNSPYPGPVNNWVTGMTGGDIIARDIVSFNMSAVWASDPVGTTRTEHNEIPTLITIAIEQIDDSESDHNEPGKIATRTFVKRIFFNGATE